VLSFDQRGAGRSREVEQRPFTLETWAGDLRALLTALDIDKPVLVGHSLGSAVALKYALSFPGASAGLVLMGADPDLANLAPRMLAAAELIEEIGLARWVSERWSQNTPFSAASLARSPEMLSRYRDMLLANDQEHYVRTCRAIASAEPLGGQIGELDLPVLVISGAEDDRTLPAHGLALAARLADGRCLELADVGHTMPFEAPDEVSSALLSFVEEIGA
jgi:pimeloyl-ACP methyl ester carboxylesterase